MNTIKIGLGYLPQLHAEFIKHNKEIDYVEIIPDGFIENGRYINLELLDQIKKIFPISAHSLDLSIASVLSINYSYLKKIAAIVKKSNAFIYSDHLAFTKVKNINANAYIPPIYCDDQIIKILDKISQLKCFIKTKFALENVPNLLLKYDGQKYTESQFIRSFIDKSKIDIIFNIDSFMMSAYSAEKPILEYLECFPLEKLSFLTIVPQESMNHEMKKIYGRELNKIVFDLLRVIIKKSSLTHITIQIRYEHNNWKSMRGFYKTINEICQEA